MKGLVTRVFSAALVAAAFVVAPGYGHTQSLDYPQRTITIVAPYPAGGVTDIFSRILADKMSQKLGGHPVIVENRSGASGTVGSKYVSEATPDGHTLLWGTSASHAANVVTLPELDYDPVTDFAPITMISKNPNVILVNPDIPVTNPRELVQYLLDHPGTPIGTAGPGTAAGFGVELLNLHMKLGLTPVHYQGGAPAMTDTVAGHIPMSILGLTSVKSLIDEGKLRPVAVLSRTRSQVLPDVETFHETVLPDFESTAWNALYTTPGTPEEVVEKLNKLVREIIESPEVSRDWAAQGFELATGEPKDLVEYMKSEIELFRRVAAENNLKFN